MLGETEAEPPDTPDTPVLCRSHIPALQRKVLTVFNTQSTAYPNDWSGRRLLRLRLIMTSHDMKQFTGYNVSESREQKALQQRCSLLCTNVSRFPSSRTHKGLCYSGCLTFEQLTTFFVSLPWDSEDIKQQWYPLEALALLQEDSLGG